MISRTVPYTVPYTVPLELPHIDNRPKCDRLCKEIACVVGPITLSCSFFVLWFLHEINSEFHSNNTLN